MIPVAIKTALKVGYPVDHIIGNVWSNSEEDVIPAGEAAVGYTAITTQASGNQYPVLQEIIKTVYGAGKGNLDDKNRIGSVYHNLRIVNGILNVEAVRVAQEKFGHHTLSGDEVRWGFEHLQLDPARVEALGPKNLFHSINVTWENHEGDGYVTFQNGTARSGTSSPTGSRPTGSCSARSSSSRLRPMRSRRGSRSGLPAMSTPSPTDTPRERESHTLSL